MLNRLSPVVKNLLLINVVVFIGQKMFSGIDLTSTLSLWNIGSPNFQPYQFFSYMFAHGGFGHILFNMMGLIFLGPMLERFWGPQKFLIFYMVTGIGAGMLYSGIKYADNYSTQKNVNIYMSNPTPEGFTELIVENFDGRVNPKVYDFVDEFDRNPNESYYIDQSKQIANSLLNAGIDYGSMLGASGAIYGILMAFGMLFPNTEMMLLFPPIPIKAKYLAMGLGAYAIYAGFKQNANDVTAHFAHLGGMVFAFIMIQYWKTQSKDFH
jgi:membrane associated rhomboid family serine protease